MRYFIPDETIDDIRRAYTAGERRSSIAARTGVSQASVYHHTQDITRALHAFAAEDVSWQDDAACIGCDVNSFVPEAKTAEARMALKVCAVCPVQEQCLGYALRTHSEGVWGGRYLTSKSQDRAELEAS